MCVVWYYAHALRLYFPGKTFEVHYFRFIDYDWAVESFKVALSLHVTNPSVRLY